MSRYPRRTGRLAMRAGSLAAALGLWQLLTTFDVNLWVRFSQFPTATDVARAFADRFSGPDYWTDLTDSLTRIVTGFLLAAVLGVATGVLMARSRLAEDLLPQDLLVEVLHGTGATVVFVTHDVDEALFLGDRVALLGAGRLIAVRNVPRPRERAAHDDPVRVALRSDILTSLGT